MIAFEHRRSASIVDRLVKLANIFRILTILSCVLFWMAGLAVLAQSISHGSWYIGAIAGFIVGYLMGLFSSALVVVVLEWMAQMLVAQGVLIDRSKTRE